MRRAFAWPLRVVTWAALLLPIVRFIAAPYRVWLEGRYAQLLLIGECDAARTDILGRFGLTQRYPGYDIRINSPSPGLETTRIVGINEISIFMDRPEEADSDHRAMIRLA